MNDDMSLGEKILDCCAYIISLFVGVLLIGWMVDMMDFENISSDNSYTESEVNPKLILQQRYARGEIGNIEYLERMTRL